MPVFEARNVLSGISVGETMRRQVVSLPEFAAIGQCIRLMIRYKINAILLLTDKGIPCGVISKTDLIVAFHHGLSPTIEAREIMNTPVYSVPAEGLLSDAIQQMLVKDVQRLFVHDDGSDPATINGVLALSDAARFRSGSCRACTAGRMIIQ